MFRNPGNKIRIMALIVFWFITISTELSAIGVIVFSCATGGTRHGLAPMAVTSIMIAAGAMIAAPFIAYLSTLFMYAFGEIVQNTTDLKEAYAGEYEYADTASPVAPVTKAEEIKEIPYEE